MVNVAEYGMLYVVQNEAHVYSQKQIITDIISISTTASAARVLLVNVVASCR